VEQGFRPEGLVGGIVDLPVMGQWSLEVDVEVSITKEATWRRAGAGVAWEEGRGWGRMSVDTRG
jgi:hypothetical protein